MRVVEATLTPEPRSNKATATFLANFELMQKDNPVQIEFGLELTKYPRKKC